jgi:hypothetical protein
MPQPPVLTGQDIAEAQGAITRLLEHSLAQTGVSRQEYVVLRVLVVRGPYASAEELHDYLAGQPQVGLTPQTTTEMLARFETQGLVAGTTLGSPGPAQATEEGKALLGRLTAAVAPGTRALFGGLDPADLATAHNVLAHIITRADELAAQP